MRYGTFDPIRTALSLQSPVGREVRTGIAIYRHEDAAKVVSAVVERGFAVATHAIGNAAWLGYLPA